MKKIVLAAALSAAFAAVPSLVMAEDAPTPDWTVAGNAGLSSDYRFRGFTQTNYKPAFQGGIDIGHSSGFYAGNWNSNVEQSLYNGASLEMDFYAGYKNTYGDLGYDVGYYYYAYPGSGSNGTTNIKNGEIYVGGSYGPVAAKFWYATTDFFSIKGNGADTKGSWYGELNGAYEVMEGVNVLGHVGYQKISDGKKVGLVADNVTDWKVGATKDLSGWLLGLAVVGTSEKNLFTTGDSGFIKGAGKTGVVASVTKTF